MKSLVLRSAFVLFSIVALAACKKDTKDCFDQQLYDAHKNDGCTADCPGVMGCDGKFYCNECEANRRGVHVKK